MKLKASDIKKSCPEFYEFLKRNNALRQYCENYTSDTVDISYLIGEDKFYCAFTWDNTKEGVYFWLGLSEKWSKEAKNNAN